jgi:hypothetical protein
MGTHGHTWAHMGTHGLTNGHTWAHMGTQMGTHGHTRKHMGTNGHTHGHTWAHMGTQCKGRIISAYIILRSRITITPSRSRTLQEK